MQEPLLELNEYQEGIITDYIEKGGRGIYHQHGRGQGATSAILYLCIHQLLSTRRIVVLLSDDPVHYLAMAIASVARDYFGQRAVFTNNGYVIAGRFLRVVRPMAQQIRGLRFDDVYGDINSETMVKREETFIYLDYRFGATPGQDGTGFYYMIVR